MSASTPEACTTDAIGKTISAAMRPCTEPERTFDIADEPDRTGGLNAVLDLSVKPNSWDIVSAIDWTPWNMTEMPTTPGTSTVAKPAAPRALEPPTAWPIFGKDEEEHEAQQERLDQGSHTNSRLVFHSTTRSRRISAPRRLRLASKTLRVGALQRCVRTHASRNSLPVRLINTSRATVRPRPGRGSRRWTIRPTPRVVARAGGTTHVNDQRVILHPRRHDGVDVALQALGQLLRAGGDLDGDDGVGTVLFFRFAGVSSARIFPWSMMATRSQS